MAYKGNVPSHFPDLLNPDLRYPEAADRDNPYIAYNKSDYVKVNILHMTRPGKLSEESNQPPMCPDWVYSPNSNAHACKDFAWFMDYTEFKSSVTTTVDGSPMKVIGCGTVYLPVQPKPDCPDVHGSLLLWYTLHIPDLPYNIVGAPIMSEPIDNVPDVTKEADNVPKGAEGTENVPKEGEATDNKPKEPERFWKLELREPSDESTGGGIFDPNGDQLAFFQPNHQPLRVFQLGGIPHHLPPMGPSALRPEMDRAIAITWADEEKPRLNKYIGWIWTTIPEFELADPERYTEAETHWIEAHYKDEYMFLQSHGLDIGKEEDRDRGVKLLREHLRSLPDEGSG